MPREERLRAKLEGMDLDEWYKLGYSDSDDDDDDDDDESDDSDGSSSPRLKNLSGFGMDCDCAERASTYHKAAWLRLEVTRRLRKKILLILREENIQLEDDDCLDRMRDYLLGDENGSEGKYTLLPSLRRYTNSLLERAENSEARRRNDEDIVLDGRLRV